MNLQFPGLGGGNVRIPEDLHAGISGRNAKFLGNPAIEKGVYVGEGRGPRVCGASFDLELPRPAHPAPDIIAKETGHGEVVVPTKIKLYPK